MYVESAEVYDALMAGKDYAAAVGELRRLIDLHRPGARTLLDVGCGTGRHLELLARDLEVEGADLSETMLEVARRRLPGVPLHRADVVELDLGTRFDVVLCLFGTVGYAGTPERLRQAVARLAGHVAPGGLLIIEPWIDPDRFDDGRLRLDQVDEPALKVARIYVQRREGRLSVLESDYVVGRPDGVTHFRERQELGLFTPEEHVDALVAAGLAPLEASSELFGYGLHVARAPA